MARLSVVRAGILLLIAAAAAALSTLGLGGASSGTSQSASIGVIAVDTDIEGNFPHTVGAIEHCVSASVGQPVDIDIVLPVPGIPDDRGMAGYQFSIFYDPSIVWIGADDPKLLLDRAPGSNVIPISDPKPDSNGIYSSAAADFGPKGVEPDGASETGPGVISRITLLPQSNGVSPLILKDVLIIDDVLQRISVAFVLSGTIHVGEPCDEGAPGGEEASDEEDKQEEEQPSEQGQQTTPSPDSGDSDVAAARSAPAPDQDTDGDGLSDAQEQQLGTNPNKLDTDDDGYSDNDEIAQGSDPLDASSTPEASPPAEVPNGGGPPPRVGGTSAWFVVFGLVATLGGASLLIVGRLAFRAQSHRQTSPRRH